MNACVNTVAQVYLHQSLYKRQYKLVVFVLLQTNSVVNNFVTLLIIISLQGCILKISISTYICYTHVPLFYTLFLN